MNDRNDVSCRKIKEAVCIDTDRVYDSCADKDCLADLRVYFTDQTQQIIDNAVSVRCRGCEVLNVCTETERVPFNKGFYSVNLTFFFLVSLDVFTSAQCPGETVCGLCMFSKKCILYGSDGNVKIFSSEFADRQGDEQLPPSTTSPKTKVQVAEPICLDAKLCRPCDCCCSMRDGINVPQYIRNRFRGSLCAPSDSKAVKVTLGVFTIVQLVRSVQMLIPAYDFCMPCKECSCDTEDPCDAFRRIKFPVDEFFPPNQRDMGVSEIPEAPSSGCGCSSNRI